MDPPQNVTVKNPKDFKLVGKPTKRLDTPDKTNGKAIFGIDVNVPGMLVAVVARPPVFGGKVKSFNAEKAKAVPGVRHVIQIDRGCGGYVENRPGELPHRKRLCRFSDRATRVLRKPC